LTVGITASDQRQATSAAHLRQNRFERIFRRPFEACKGMECFSLFWFALASSARQRRHKPDSIQLF
jgi:hypothetical protein